MARPKKPKIRESQLEGFKHFKLLVPVLEKLHLHACERDKAGNRRLHYDQYAALILLYFFNPIVSSLRSIQQISELKKVQRLLKCPRASLGSLSEAARVFDADLLRGIIGDLLGQLDELRPLQKDSNYADIRRIVTIVDATVLHVLPKLVEAMWLPKSGVGFKLHTHFELLRGVPTRMDMTGDRIHDGNMLRTCIESDRLYVLDAAYMGFALFQQIVDARSSFVCRLLDNVLYEVIDERPLSTAATAATDANVLHDRLVRFTGTTAAKAGFVQTARIVEVKCSPHRKRGSRPGQGGPNQGESLLIATDVLDAPAEVIALLYKQRWSIETFFRFFKHVLGCRHLLSSSPNGIEIQTYLAIIACLLIALWTGRKPTLRTYEMICYYFAGLADEEELLAHIGKLQPHL